ncbi:hypothetical protein T439DRAFT_377387 [Meredithblackwellia eburnea MCA 4105]
MSLVTWQDKITSLCHVAGVPRLASHIPTVLYSCTFFFAVQGASQWLSARLFPEQFGKFSKRTRLDWGLHSTGWVHALIVTPLCFYFIRNPSPSLVLDPIFGFSPVEEQLFAFSGGYFLYDLLISVALVRTHGVPFLLHATSCCFIFFKAFTPFLNGMSPNFLIWELSTIFLHPHWFMDKLGMTGSTLQLVNGGLLLGSFFGARICYGGLMTYRLWNLLDDPRISPAMRWGFRTANLALCGLNISWFRLMVLSVKKRLDVRETRDAAKDDKNGKSE